jgi:peptide/nickel transport system permease protein
MKAYLIRRCLMGIPTLIGIATVVLIIIRLAPWISTFAGLVIMVTILSFNILGDTLRDFPDPRLRRQV